MFLVDIALSSDLALNGNNKCLADEKCEIFEI